VAAARQPQEDRGNDLCRLVSTPPASKCQPVERNVLTGMVKLTPAQERGARAWVSVAGFNAGSTRLSFGVFGRHRGPADFEDSWTERHPLPSRGS
jgi:hypothetical protein